MSDKQFIIELEIRAYIDQISGYPFGHPGREKFKPVVPVFLNENGTTNRERTLLLPCWHTFSETERQKLLEISNW